MPHAPGREREGTINAVSIFHHTATVDCNLRKDRTLQNKKKKARLAFVKNGPKHKIQKSSNISFSPSFISFSQHLYTRPSHILRIAYPPRHNQFILRRLPILLQPVSARPLLCSFYPLPPAKNAETAGGHHGDVVPKLHSTAPRTNYSVRYTQSCRPLFIACCFIARRVGTSCATAATDSIQGPKQSETFCFSSFVIPLLLLSCTPVLLLLTPPFPVLVQLTFLAVCPSVCALSPCLSEACRLLLLCFILTATVAVVELFFSLSSSSRVSSSSTSSSSFVSSFSMRSTDPTKHQLRSTGTRTTGQANTDIEWWRHANPQSPKR